jgi:hypothetical protein
MKRPQAEKTQNISFSCKSTNTDSSAKFLGIFIDGQLKWDTHIDQITTRLSRLVYLFINLKSVVEEKYILMAYFALLQSVFRYGLELYDNSSKVKDILLIKKKSLEF